MGDLEAQRVIAPEPTPDPAPVATCRSCDAPLGEEHGRTCAICGACYHRDCAGRLTGCETPACPLAEPSHPAWTREARAEGWLFIDAPHPPPWLNRLLLLAALPIAGLPEGERIAEAGKIIALQAGVEPWMLLSMGLGLTLPPWAATLALAAWQNATQRAVLLDAHGLLFDHSPRWRGARLFWDSIAGYRLVTGGVRLVVRGRPWTRVIGPTVPCDGAQQHQVVVMLEAHGVARFDA